MVKFLGYFSLVFGIYYCGLIRIVDMLGQFGFMLYANSFFWFGTFWPIFDMTKTVTGNIFFILLVMADYGYLNLNRLTTRKHYYYYSLIDTILTGICSFTLGTSIYMDALNISKDMSSINFFIVIFLFGYPFMIYTTYIAKVYYLELPEFQEELTSLDGESHKH